VRIARSALLVTRKPLGRTNSEGKGIGTDGGNQMTKKCARCDFEYDDMYDGCPQCARATIPVIAPPPSPVPSLPVVPTAPTAQTNSRGTGLFVAAVILVSMTALLCVLYYPFRAGGGLLEYFANAVFSLWWIGGLACAFAARHRGRFQAVKVAAGILGISLAIGAGLQLAASTPTSNRSQPYTTAPQASTSSFGESSVLPSSFWAAIVASIPESESGAEAEAERTRTQLVAEAGTAYIAYSSEYPSLRSGYIVVFSGPYSTGAEAESEAQTLQSAGFKGAYPRQFVK